MRSAILLGILACVIYPALPTGAVDPWGAVDPRTAWITVILIAGIGFVNYVLWKLYGARGIELTGFLGGLVNSTVTVGELSGRVKELGGQFVQAAYRGVLLATAAMLVRNGVLLGILYFPSLRACLLPLFLMLLTCGILVLVDRRRGTEPSSQAEQPIMRLESPFSLKSALKFGVLFLILQVAGFLAERGSGYLGVYIVSLVGGLVSSASAVAAVAVLGAKGTVTSSVAAISAILAIMASTVINAPLVLRSGNQALTRRIFVDLAMVLVAGLLGIAGHWVGMH